MKTNIKNETPEKVSGYILVYRFKKGISHSQKVRFLQKFYGYTDHSNYDKYHYEREGIIEHLRAYSPFKSVLVVHKKDLINLLKAVKKHLKIVWKREIILTSDDFKRWEK